MRVSEAQEAVEAILREGQDVLYIGLSSALIRWCGLMTTVAVALEIAVSFLVNFFVRKFFIFKG